MKGNLASYNGNAAVFYQEAPDNQDKGWAEGKRQYPRLDFFVDLQADAERKNAGNLVLSIWCDDYGSDPEEINQYLKNELKDLFLNAETTYCLVWKRSDGFTKQNEANPSLSPICGIETVFDVLEFTRGSTFDPDPILALEKYTKQMQQEFRILPVKGADYFKAGQEKPAVYFRMDTQETESESYVVCWIKAVIAVHVFAVTPEQRQNYTRYLTSELMRAREVKMLDDSPLFLQNVKVSSGADYLTQGQILLSVKFGMLRDPVNNGKVMQSATINF